MRKLESRIKSTYTEGNNAQRKSSPVPEKAVTPASTICYRLKIP